MLADALNAATSTLSNVGAAIGADVPLLAAAKLWTNRVFEKEVWTVIVFILRMLFCISAALLLMYEVRAHRMGVPLKERAKRRIGIVLSVLAFGVYFDYGNPNVRYAEYYHRHEFYHYYLGAKYSSELGYKRLYDCTLVAEIDNGRRAQVEKREVRDLSVNLIKPVKDTYILTEPERCRDRFTTARWEDFKKDVDWFYRSARGSYWERMQQDHGFNPPPVWTMTGKLFANLHPADDLFFKQMAAIDIALQAGMILMLYWAFGWRVGMTGAVFWGCNAAANFYWTGGAFLRQDWMFMLVASVCLARKKYFFWAGFALMWSALLRVFPAALFGGWAAMVVLYFIERLRGRPPAPGDTGILSYLHPSHRRIIAGSVLAIAVLVPASMQATEGTKTWREFTEHIQTHKNTPLTNHMGLPTILSHTWEGRMRFTRNENLDDAFEEWKRGRNERIADRKYIQLGVFAAYFLWIAWAVRGSRRTWIGPALSLPLVMCLTDLTCYYYSMFIIAAVLVKYRREVGVTLLATGTASVVLLGKSIGYADTGVSGFFYVDDNFTAQSYLFLIFCTLMLWACSRPLSIGAIADWWNRVPLATRLARQKGAKGDGSRASVSAAS